ncbi:hypothetical protein LY76DRAFT_397430 [Colletotrichum caudatum]|nr:hypothetical protein LY76DRAFT_397430 [Colletotrichum caudatum]
MPIFGLDRGNINDAGLAYTRCSACPGCTRITVSNDDPRIFVLEIASFSRSDSFCEAGEESLYPRTSLCWHPRTTSQRAACVKRRNQLCGLPRHRAVTDTKLATYTLADQISLSRRSTPWERLLAIRPHYLSRQNYLFRHFTSWALPGIQPCLMWSLNQLTPTWLLCLHEPKHTGYFELSSRRRHIIPEMSQRSTKTCLIRHDWLVNIADGFMLTHTQGAA